MKDLIGNTAGKIWETLGEKEAINIAMLPKMLKEKSEVVYQALGWLARENKITYSDKGAQKYVSLSDPELRIFRTVH